MLTCHFMLTMIAAMCGGPFLYGFNMAVINTPSPMVRMFYAKVYATRAGVYPLSANATSAARSFYNTTVAVAANSSLLGNDTVPLHRAYMRQLETEFNVELLWTITISICLIGGMLGAFASGKLADKLGRKKALLANQSFCIVGAILFAIVKVTNLPELMFVARFLVGVASGVGLGLAPLYLSEISTASLRGPATSSCHLAVTFGILVAQFLGLAVLLGTDDGWPYLFAVTAVPSFVTLAILPFCPETPRFMMSSRGANYETILKVYIWLYGPEHGEAEAMTLQKEIVRRRQSSTGSPQKPVSPSIINPKVLYTADGDGGNEAVDISGVAADGDSKAVAAQLLSDNPTSEKPPLSRQESESQRVVTLSRLFCTEEFRLPIFLALWLHVTQQWSGINAVIAYSGNIFSQIVSPDIVQYAVLSTGVASVVSTGVMLPFMSRLGRRRVVLVSCAVMTLSHILLTVFSALSPMVPALNYGALVFVLIYICGYAGTGCTPAILVSEMFLQNARAVAMSLAIATRWGSAFVLLLVFPYMSRALGVYAFLIFGFICLLSLVLFCLWLHETRGKPPLQIHDQLSHGFEHVQFHLHHHDWHLGEQGATTEANNGQKSSES